MSIETILIVEDEPLIRQFLSETLKRKKYRVQVAEGVKNALKILEEHYFDLVITDMKMPDGSGLDVLTYLREHSQETLSLVITAFATVQNAVEAMRLGAFNYVIKPFSPDTIEAMIQKASEHAQILCENHALKREKREEKKGPLKGEIFHSPVMREVLSQVKKIAQSQANVMITGESGTGKEVISRLIHEHSLRKDQPYICVNCAAIPETLLESELFGHERGAFTGANQKRVGRFELAHKGTLLLDEITEIPLSMQVKLLRAIQEKCFERVGGTRSLSVDVRFLSTSNRKIKKSIEEKQFREDLYYRLNVIPIHLPPLRERREDIVPLAQFFLQKFCHLNCKREKSLTPEAIEAIEHYHWPGNIRELANLMERVTVIDLSDKVQPDHLSLQMLSGLS